MTREEARKAAEVMLAYANGEEIEAECLDGKYRLNGNPSFNWKNANYRVKPKLTYSPFKDMYECWNEMQKHPDFGWIIYNKYYHNICDITSNEITILYECEPWCLDFKSCIEEITFTDGTPFGIKED